jgi:uncharacterized protein YjiS (DUF1127 family)
VATQNMVVEIDLDKFRSMTNEKIEKIVSRARRSQVEVIVRMIKKIGKILKNLFNIIKNVASAAQVTDQLSRLSDHDLADIGIRREKIAQQSYGELAAYASTSDAKIYDYKIQVINLTNESPAEKAA